MKIEIKLVDCPLPPEMATEFANNLNKRAHDQLGWIHDVKFSENLKKEIDMRFWDVMSECRLPHRVKITKDDDGFCKIYLEVYFDTTKSLKIPVDDDMAKRRTKVWKL